MLDPRPWRSVVTACALACCATSDPPAAPTPAPAVAAAPVDDVPPVTPAPAVTAPGAPIVPPTPTPTTPEPEPFARDVCHPHAGITGTDPDRTLYWSCLGVALEIPRGIGAQSGAGDLEGLVLEVYEDSEQPTLFGRIVATRLEWSAGETLKEGVGDWAFRHDGDQWPLRALRPARTAGKLVRQTFVATEGTLSVVRALRVLDDGLHQIRFDLASPVADAKAIERRVAPLLKLRPITPAEFDELRRVVELPDWSKRLADRRLPMKLGATAYSLVLCADGRYLATDATGVDAVLPELPARGTWRILYDTIQIDDPKRWRVGGVYLEHDRIEIGHFGHAVGHGPFEPVERCP